ncbi:unnamed protein product [Protopolystoma xenopodis]|uniref:Uncharacterized protein n=1 Tax=Protopolystoma xenopodis TaxID=117903 RepID=A0A3S5CMD7_9PLAT|nr:unnamed protein product [Protopolystoma xenopodis]
MKTQHLFAEVEKICVNMNLPVNSIYNWSRGIRRRLLVVPTSESLHPTLSLEMECTPNGLIGFAFPCLADSQRPGQSSYGVYSERRVPLHWPASEAPSMDMLKHREPGVSHHPLATGRTDSAPSDLASLNLCLGLPAMQIRQPASTGAVSHSPTRWTTRQQTVAMTPNSQTQQSDAGTGSGPVSYRPAGNAIFCWTQNSKHFQDPRQALLLQLAEESNCTIWIKHAHSLDATAQLASRTCRLDAASLAPPTKTNTDRHTKRGHMCLKPTSNSNSDRHFKPLTGTWSTSQTSRSRLPPLENRRSQHDFISPFFSSQLSSTTLSTACIQILLSIDRSDVLVAYEQWTSRGCPLFCMFLYEPEQPIFSCPFFSSHSLSFALYLSLKSLLRLAFTHLRCK